MPNFIATETPRKDPVRIEIEKTTDSKILANYFTDESRIIIGHAEEVCFPKAEEHVARIVKEANEKALG